MSQESVGKAGSGSGPRLPEGSPTWIIRDGASTSWISDANSAVLHPTTQGPLQGGFYSISLLNWECEGSCSLSGSYPKCWMSLQILFVRLKPWQALYKAPNWWSGPGAEQQDWTRGTQQWRRTLKSSVLQIIVWPCWSPCLHGVAQGSPVGPELCPRLAW